MTTPNTCPFAVSIVTDEAELAKARAQDERFKKNIRWFEAHAAEFFPKYRGKILCVAGEELFVADSAEEVIAMARNAHPEDDGFFTAIVPKERHPRIYAY